MAEKRFEGKTAIVTGAGSGLGRATALLLGSEGATVACLDMAQDAAEGTVATIGSAGGRARAWKVDVSDPASVRDAFDAAVAAHGRPDVLVTCAGIGRFANSHEMPFEDWKRIIDVNLTGTFLSCQAALRHMVAAGKGSIVTVASNAGLMGQAYSAAYCASKGGVVNLTRALCDEYIERGIRVNCVAPGGIATPLQRAFYALPEGADPNKLGKVRSPFGNSTPEEIAELVAFVASDHGRYMAGSIVSIDGGITT
ncbi:MAG: SDR family NAD(P)-dependent oxidoreductase [Alphaproteobacteria bacterium]